MSLTEKLKLRCEIMECNTVTLPAGTAMGGAIDAGTPKVFNDVLAIAITDVAVDDSDDSVDKSEWITRAPKIEVDRDTGDSAWSVGSLVYYNGTNFTTTSTNLNACGIVVEPAGTDDSTGVIRFVGDNISVGTPDIDDAS